MIFNQVIQNWRQLDNVVPNCQVECTSQRWTRICWHWRLNHRSFTAFHPLTECQMEWQNQIIVEYLTSFCNNKQDAWVELLPLAEFAYNNSIHHSMYIMPFWANNWYHPLMQFKPLKAPCNMRSQILAGRIVSGLWETHRLLREN